MKKISKILPMILLLLLLVTTVVFSTPIKETIEVYRNFISLKVNGKSVEADNFMLDGAIYVPIQSVSELLGGNVEWDGQTRMLDITNISESGSFKWIEKEIMEEINAYNPQFNCSDLSINADEIDALKLEQNGITINKTITVADGLISIKSDTIDGLELNQSYSLKIFMKNNDRYRIDFTSSSLPDITDTGERRVIYVPAMPEKGFNFPYFLSIPEDRYKEENKDHRRYLIVESNNTGPSSSFQKVLDDTQKEIESGYTIAGDTARKLWLPMIMPVFPRPNVDYHYDGEYNDFYTHALDRDTATLHLKMKDKDLEDQLTHQFANAGFDANDFYSLDKQLVSMIDHAIEYLNQYEHNVETDKVFLSGYSASGTFVDRFANLHPDRVKAVSSGATLDDMMLPLTEYKGKNLIFPIGTYDYKEITGRSFDLNLHNSIARLIYMGEDDNNNVVPYSDCYGDTERDIIISLWGMEVLPRAKSLIQLYGESNGKGIFILDRDESHGYSEDMRDYMFEFFRANRDSDTPVYPIPKDPNQLKYTLYE